MKRRAPSEVLRVADAICDGAQVDWKKEAAEHPEMGRTLDCLKVVESIVNGYRALATTPIPPPPVLPPRPAPRRPRTAARKRRPAALFGWGPLRAVEAIGSGSFGEVYRAFDPTLEREVALKLWRAPAGSSMDRLLVEARRLARVRHPNVLVVHGADEHDGRAGMWTDLIDGMSLERCLAERGPFGATEAAGVGIELCRALAALHAAGLVHRDVKTANVMREHGGRIVLMDFGAAGEVGPDGAVRLEDGSIGTPITLAPEQLDGAAATPATDLYALGVLLYRLLTNAYPIDARDLDDLRARHRSGTRTPLRDRRPDLPARLVQAIERALEPLGARHESAGAMERAIADALDIAPATAAAAPRPSAVPHDLPETLTRFLGAEADVARGLERAGAGSWLTITGPAASGKTRLALRLAEILLPSFPDGVRFVDLEGLEDPDRLTERVAVALALGDPGPSRRGDLEALAASLADARSLLVLDHTDRARDAVRRLGAALSRECPHLGVIATGPEPLGLDREQTLALDALPIAYDEAAPDDAAHPPFVGRERELALLARAAEQARGRSGGTLLVGGEAGLGKSRLMDEFRRRAEAAGLLCLGGRCSYRSGRNFEPFIEALEEFSRRFASASDAFPRADATLAGAGSLFAGLDALMSTRQRAQEPRSREQVWFLLDSLLKRIARYETLVLFLDDLHWADEGTASLLSHVTRNSGGARLLVLGSYRPEEASAPAPEVHALEDALRLLATSPRFQNVLLEPLDAANVATLVHAVRETASPDGDEARHIHERAQGNPFFAIEMARLLGDSAAAAPTAALPRTIADVVMRRLARLGEEERDLLDLAAVEGERFHARTLESVTQSPRLAVLKRLRALDQEHHLVVSTEDGYRFSHGLIREVVLRELPDGLRREYHGIVADHLLRDFGGRADHAGRIADQLFEARRHAEAAKHYWTAAREARRLFLYARALRHLERAFESCAAAGSGGADRGVVLQTKSETLLLLGRPQLAREAAEAALAELARAARGGDAMPGALGADPASPDLEANARETLGEAALAQGDLDAAEAAFLAARERHGAGGRERRVALCDHRLGAVAARRGDFAAALARIEGALAGLRGAGDELDRARIRLDLGDVLYRRGDYDRSLATFDDAVTALRRLDERHDLARGLNRLGNALFQSGRAGDALARYQEAMKLAVDLEDAQSIARFKANLGNVHLVRGELAQALDHYRAALASFESIGDRGGEGQTLMALGNVCFTRSDYEEAAGYYRAAITRRGEAGDRVGSASALDNLGVAEYFRGRLGPAREHHEQALRIRGELGDRPGRIESAINLSGVSAVLGDVAAAERGFAEAERDAIDLGDPRKRARAMLGRACLAWWAGDRDGCGAIAREVESLGVSEPTIRARALLFRGLAEPAPAEAREALLRQALDQAIAAESKAEQATARLALASLAHETGRAADARAEVEAALAAAAERVPLLEARALRLRGEIAGSTSAGDDARLSALAAGVRGDVPGALAAAWDAAATRFPLP